MKRFLYLFQVAQDLPPGLEQAVSKDSDVLFLSYRSRSTDPRAIYYPFSSWTQGRNRLLREVLDRRYLYFVFCDGDVRLEFTGSGARSSPPGQSPWRAFERFLLTHEPAVGTPAYHWHLSGRCCETHEVATLRFFDPLMNAFHREALPTLLPYCDLLEEASSDYSGSIVCSIAADLYPGNVLQTNRVRVINPESLRGWSELLMTKPETLYLESLRDPLSIGRYRRQPAWWQLAHPGLGEPRPKPPSYRISQPELALRYRLDHPLWVRKRELLDLPREADFNSDSAESDRARRWRAFQAATTPPRATPLLRLWRAVRPLREPLGLVRSRRPFVLAGRIRHLGHQARIQAIRWRRGLRQPSARALWQEWTRSPNRFFEFGGADPSTLLVLLGHVLERLDHEEIVFVEVGTGMEEVLGQLRDGTVLSKPVISVGVDRVQTRRVTAHSAYVLGEVSSGHFALAAILEQYGLPDRLLHYVRITEGHALTAFRTLREPSEKCLFLTVRAPREAHGEFERAGFRLLALTVPGPDAPVETTFVNQRLLRTLLPKMNS